MYTLVYTKKALHQLKKLREDMQNRIIHTLERIRIRPYSNVKKLINSPYFRLRVGGYRIILDIKEEKLVIFVIEVGHRRTIYK